MELTAQRHQGWFSLLRWRSDAARDEARNVALLLVDERGGFDAFRAAPLSTISPRLHEQGLLDATLVGLERQFKQNKFTLERLTAVHEQLHHSLYLTKPQPVAVKDLDETMTALYRAFIASRAGGSRLTKSAVLDRVVAAYRKRGLDVRRGAYVGDFIFDAVVKDGRKRRLIEVLSFASPRKDWTPIERDAGHFLFALGELNADGSAVIEPPSERVAASAKESYGRVARWFRRADVPIATPSEVIETQTHLAITE